MDLNQYVELTVKETGAKVHIRSSMIAAIVEDPNGIIVVLPQGLAYMVKEPLGEVAALMKKAEE